MEIRANAEGQSLAAAGLAITLAFGLLAIEVAMLSGRSPVPALSEAPGLTSNAGAPSTSTAETRDSAAKNHGKLPVSFIPNRGQTDDSVRYYAKGAGHAFYFTSDGAMLSFTKKGKGHALQLSPLGANPDAKLEPGDRAAGIVNYMTASSRHTNLPTYEQLTYRELWPGIDMVFRGRGGKLKYEFHLQPGADPAKIRLAYRGADGLALGSAGNLLIQTPLGTLRDSRPVSYQLVGDRRVPVGSRYDLKGGGAYGFALGSSYDPARPMVIDPGLIYSTYLGGNNIDLAGSKHAVDGAGNVYVTGLTRSPNFPTTVGSFDPTFNSSGGTNDAFVTKLNASGTGLVYSTYLGAATSENGVEIEVDASGNAYIAGQVAGSGSFPTTAGAFDTTLNGAIDAFVTKLDPSGSALVYSTFIGGAANEQDVRMALDGAGNVYLTGLTQTTMGAPYPTTAGALDTTYNGGTYDGYVTKLNPTGSALVYSTYLGGSANEGATVIQGLDAAIAVDGTGSAYVTGDTSSTNFPVTMGAFDTTYNAGGDAFVAKLNPAGSALDFSTFLGGASADRGLAIALDGTGSAYVTGATDSAVFPTTAGAFDTTPNGSTDAYITKLDPAGSALDYSAYLGGTGSDVSRGLAVDGDGTVLLTGDTTSTDFPATANSVDTSYNGIQDAFVTRIDAAGSEIHYSTFLGGAAGDGGRSIALYGGSAYVVGSTNSTNFPTSVGAYDTTYNGGGVGAQGDVFITTLDPFVGPAYPRPGSANPMRISLAVAYAPCSSPNTTHVAPLNDPSCTPATLESTLLKTGTVGQSSAYARLTGVLGDPMTPADEADVSFEIVASDVRKSDNTDYTGQVIASFELRITDSASGSSGEAAATVQDTRFAFPVPCVDNGGAGGANCSLTTTADTLVPGFAKEGKRALLSVLAAELLDVGGDGSIIPGAGTCPPTCGSGDENVFMREAIFAP